MSVISMMEMNAKSPFLWDWENLVMLNTKPIEAQKKLQLLDSEIEEIEGFEVGSFYSSGGTGSDLGYMSSSKSSKSTSIDSSIKREIKGTKFTLETKDGIQHDLGSKKELLSSGLTGTSSTIESSVASGESLIALELGKRTYFGDVSAASNVKSSAVTLAPETAVKKSKSSSLNVETQRCQVEGCNLDLSLAKAYHRKHRVCESHSKCPKVVINGLERRFCQQCSQFHGLSEFDQKKRSCRKRLSDHNARRRKPKPQFIQFNSMRLASSLYEASNRNQLSVAFNQAQVLQTRDYNWDSSSDSKVFPAKPAPFTTKSGFTDELYPTHNGPQSPGSELSPASTRFLPFKGAPSEMFHRGLPVSVPPSNTEAAQDLRALSLLSTNSWCLCHPEPSALDHSMHDNHASLAQPLPAINEVALGGPTSPSEFWQAEEPVPSGPGSNTSRFQLFKEPTEPAFFLY